MPDIDPMTKTREDYQALMEHLSSDNSPVGIDAKFTHAIVIDYLQQISKRLDAIEKRLDG